MLSAHTVRFNHLLRRCRWRKKYIRAIPTKSDTNEFGLSHRSIVQKAYFIMSHPVFLSLFSLLIDIDLCRLFSCIFNYFRYFDLHRITYFWYDFVLMHDSQSHSIIQFQICIEKKYKNMYIEWHYGYQTVYFCNKRCEL